MINRIHILGASGSGTTTLAKALVNKIDYKHFDTDDYFWIDTEEPFTVKREVNERRRILKLDLDNNERWILSGSLCGWGDVFIPYFDLVVYLGIPKDVRLNRLVQREKQRYGAQIEPGGKSHQSFIEFIEWAQKYDEGGFEVRSKTLHYDWISKLTCPVIRIEGDTTVEERVNIVLQRLNYSESNTKMK